MRTNHIQNFHLMLLQRVDGPNADYFAAAINRYPGGWAAINALEPAEQARWLANFTMQQLNTVGLPVGPELVTNMHSAVQGQWGRFMRNRLLPLYQQHQLPTINAQPI